MHALIDLLVQHGLLSVFLVTFAARAGMPLPGAPLLVIAGGMAAAGRLSWPLALMLSTLANLLGDGVWFQAGRSYGHRVMKLLCRISLSPDSCVRQSESLISRWGGRSLLAAKFLPGISVVAAPMAGALGMTWRRFVLFDLAAGAVWSTVFLALGWALRDQIQQTLEVLAGAGLVALLAVVLVLALLIGQRAWRRIRFTRALASTRITAEEVLSLMEQGREAIFIDVRADASRTIDPRRIPGALLAELKTIQAHATNLSRESLLVLYCNCPNEVSASRAAQLLSGQGFKHARALAGGLDGWAAAGRPIAVL